MVREAVRDDLDSIVQLNRFLNPNDSKINENKLKLTWEKIIENSDFFKYYVLEIDSRIISACTITVNPNLTRSCRPFAVVENVITHPDYRGEGHGKELMKRVIDYAKKCDCYKIMLLSSSDRVNAHGFYSSLGFDSKSKRAFQLRINN